MLSNVIFVNSGQCGNQVGHEVIRSLYQHYSTKRNPSNSYFEVNHDLHDMFFRPSQSASITSNSINSGSLPSSSISYARAVCLDTEPKVIESCMGHAKLECGNSHGWYYDPRSVAYRHGGAGNNWALGYSMCSGEFMDIAINLIRREMEQCDMPPTILSIHSMAGGTGSGLGTKMTEAIHDHFHDMTRINFVVLPYHFGEVVVQNYNALLSLSIIDAVSDGVIIFENEIAKSLCKQAKGVDRPTLQDMNNIIAANLVPILLPKYMNDQQVTLTDDIIHLCSHPGYKLLDIKTVPQTSDNSVDFTFDSWPTLIKSLLRMQTLGVWSEIGLSRLLSTVAGVQPDYASPENRSKQNAMIDTDDGLRYGVEGNVRCRSNTSTIQSSLKLCTTVGVTMTLRGDDSLKAIHAHSDMIKESHLRSHICDPLSGQSMQRQRHLLTGYDDRNALPPTLFANIIPEPVRLCYSDDICNRYGHSGSVLSNSQAILPTLNRILTKASHLYEAKAYLHQYDAYGVADDAFLKAFKQVGQVVQNYRELSVD